MQILKASFYKYRNEQHFDFFKSVMLLWVESGLDKSLISKAIDPLTSSFNNEDAIIRLVQGSLVTSDIVSADKKRDGLVRGFKKVVQASIAGGKPEEQVAAQKVLRIYDNFGKIDTLPLDEETASINNLIQELEVFSAKNPGVFQAMGILPWIDNLRVANQDFTKLWLERIQDNAQEPAYTVREARKAVEEEFRKLIAVVQGTIYFPQPTVSAGSYSYGCSKSSPDLSAQCGDFLSRVNSLIERNNTALKVRKGKADAKKEEEDPENPENPESPELNPED